MKWWYVAKDPWSAQSTRGPWTTENALQATKGISAGSYITHQYLSGDGVHHHELWNTGYWNIQTPGFPQRNGAFSSTKPEHIALQCREYETQPCLLGGLCCTSKTRWASRAAKGTAEGGVCLSSCGYLRHSSTLGSHPGGRAANSRDVCVHAKYSVSLAGYKRQYSDQYEWILCRYLRLHVTVCWLMSWKGSVWTLKFNFPFRE